MPPNNLYRNLEERLVANSVLSQDTHLGGDPCWIWIGKIGANGYGRIQMRCKETGRHLTCLVHRIAYAELVGPIPDGMEIDHKCRVQACINPNHLEPVDGPENIRRRDERKRAC